MVTKRPDLYLVSCQLTSAAGLKERIGLCCNVGVIVYGPALF